MNRTILPVFLMSLLFLAPRLWAQTTAPATAPTANVTVDAAKSDEGEKVIRAVVTSAGQPVEGATVRFTVRRTFGALVIGLDKTLDDGTAEAKFPLGLKSGGTSELLIAAEVVAPAQYAGARAEKSMEGGVAVPAVADPFPRALWAPHAPLPMVLTIVVLLGGVWTTYAFVVSQILAIRKAGMS